MDVPSSEAAEALAAMRQSRERLAAAANCPPERHMAFAVVLGGLVACQAAPPFATLAIEAVLFVCVGLIFLWDRRRTGMFINGYRAGRTRILTFSLLATALALGALGVWLKHGEGLWWGPIPCGLATATIAFFASLVWQGIYRREMTETP
jgi:hypothetical protein